MTPTPLLRSLLVLGISAATCAAQEWSAEKLAESTPGFQSDAFEVRLLQIGKLLPHRQEMFSALVSQVHGDHREYRLQIGRLLDELSDPRWQVREQAERTLVEIGGRARDMIQQRKEAYEVLEQHIRCARILDALSAKGLEQEEREKKLLRGLVATSLYLDADPRLLRALRSALGHTDPTIVESALRALGKLGGDEESGAVRQVLTTEGSVHRIVAAGALGRIRGDQALAACREMLLGGELDRTASFAMLRALHSRGDAGALRLLAELANGPDALLAAGARTKAPPGAGATRVRVTLPSRTPAEGRFGGMFGESLLLLDAFEGLPAAELAFADCNVIEFSDHAPLQPAALRVFLTQGSLVTGELLGIDGTGVRLRSPLFGDLVLPRTELQGIAFDPALDRLVGASTEKDRVKLASGEFADGELLALERGNVRLRAADGSERTIERADVAGILFRRPRMFEPDATVYSRLDLADGQRLFGFLAHASADSFSFCAPLLGAAVVPMTNVVRTELGVGGGAMWGFTLVADYSDNRVIEYDDQGRQQFVLEEVFGAWDAECLENGNLLITEFSISRVQEVDRKGKTVWAFEDLKNPYDADRLPNGNTLIADTFGSRVIEVSPRGEIVWSFAKDIRPFDCERLANGNTLIADILKDRIVEVSASGEIVWEVKNLPNVHDADRLPNGNTLVTLRNKGVVLEMDRDGKVVWELSGLSSPSDADRLPNGNTIVAENLRVREFDRHRNEVWKKESTWAVEVNRY